MDELTRQSAPSSRISEWSTAPTQGVATKIVRAETAILRLECEPTTATLTRLWQVLESEGISPLTIDIGFCRPYQLVEILVQRGPAGAERSMLQAVRRIMAIRRADLFTQSRFGKDIETVKPPSPPPAKRLSTRLLRLFNG